MHVHKSRNKASLFLILAAVTLLASCDRTRIFEKYEEIPGGNWEAGVKVGFDVEVKDTNQACNLFVNIRTTDNYPYQNLYLFMTTTFPDKTFARDTLQFLILDEKGKPYGKCSGSMCENRFMIDQQVKFPIAGIYRFDFEQGMRTGDGKLPQVRNIGIRLEKFTGVK